MVRLATHGFFRFCRKCSGMKVERRFHTCTDIKCPMCPSKMRTTFGPFWPYFYWFHGLSRLSIGGLPRTETDHPNFNHRWSVRQAKILHFLQHWYKKDITPLLMHWSYTFLALTRRYHSFPLWVKDQYGVSFVRAKSEFPSIRSCGIHLKAMFTRKKIKLSFIKQCMK